MHRGFLVYSSMDRKDILEIAIQATMAASDKIMEIYSRDFSVEEKEDKSPLTEADTAAHFNYQSAFR